MKMMSSPTSMRLVEADGVPLQHLPAEQLEAAQAVVDRAVAERRPVGALAEHRDRRPAAMSDDLPEDDVGAVAVGHREHAFERLGAEVVVRVAEEHVSAAGVGEADVARPAGAAGLRLPDDPDDAAVVGGVEVEQVGAAVGGPVVHDDDLLADPLDQQGGQAPVQIGPAVVNRNDDADIDRVVVAGCHHRHYQPAPRRHSVLAARISM